MGHTYTSFYGGGTLRQPSGDIQLSIANGRSQSINAQSAGLDIAMPDADQYTHTGGPMFKVFNVGAFSFDLIYPDTTLIGTLAPQRSATMYLSGNPGDDRVWHLKIEDTNGVIPASTPTLPTDPTNPTNPTDSDTIWGTPDTISDGAEISGPSGAPA